MVSLDKRYEEVGHTYRFFLAWRHAAVAGYLVVIFSAVTAKDTSIPIWAIFLGTAAIGFLLWHADRRIQDLYSVTLEVGGQLEGSPDGLYRRLRNGAHPSNSPAGRRLSHSEVIGGLFWAGIIAFGSVGALQSISWAIQFFGWTILALPHEHKETRQIIQTQQAQIIELQNKLTGLQGQITKLSDASKVAQNRLPKRVPMGMSPSIKSTPSERGCKAECETECRAMQSSSSAPALAPAHHHPASSAPCTPPA